MHAGFCVGCKSLFIFIDANRKCHFSCVLVCKYPFPHAKECVTTTTLDTKQVPSARCIKQMAVHSTTKGKAVAQSSWGMQEGVYHCKAICNCQQQHHSLMLPRDGLWHLADQQSPTKKDAATLPAAGLCSQVRFLHKHGAVFLFHIKTHPCAQVINAAALSSLQELALRRINSTAKRMQASSIFAAASESLEQKSGKRHTSSSKLHQSGTWQPGWGTAGKPSNVSACPSTAPQGDADTTVSPSPPLSI